MKAFSEALARIVWVWQTTSEQLGTLQRALTEFRHSVDSIRPALEKPRLFLAYPKEAEEDVLTNIEKVLNEFEARVEVRSWKTMSESGNITEQVVKEISRSEIGICYVSEKSCQNGSGKRKKYTDNQNVLFEAGMFHALRASKDNPSRGWIPIREHERFSGPPCFDIAAERTVIVPRDDDGKMETRQFRDELRKIIQTAMGSA